MSRVSWLLSRNAGILLFLAMMLLPLLGLSESASAAVWTDRALYHGYFTDANPRKGGICEHANCAHQGYVLNAAIGGLAVPTDIDSVPELTNFLKSYNRNGNERDVMGSGFIVQSMLGRSGDEANANGGRNISDADWVELEDRMNAVDIDWDRQWSTSSNTYMQAISYDVALDAAGQTDNAIVFSQKGTGVPMYALFRNCANPDGNLNGLPDVPATQVACGILTLSTSKPEVDQPLTVTTTVTYSGGPSADLRTVTDATISVTGPGGYAQKWTITDSDALTDDDDGKVTLKSPEFSAPATGIYTVTWEAKVNGVSPKKAPCSDTFKVRNYPYFEAIGGDVAAGSGFVTAPTDSCGTASHNSKAGIASWNKNTAPYSGAGGQYATFAWDYIQEFASNKGSGRQPEYLSFSNQDAAGQSPDSVNPSAGRYGGFSGVATCVDDWKDRPVTPRPVPGAASVNLDGLNGTYWHSGNLTIPANVVSNGKKTTIYVNGDVSITGDIVYGGSSLVWSDVTQIPAFRLVVQGTIHIGSNVSRIDGVYVAVPDGNGYTTTANSYSAPKSGTISTCSSGFTVLSPSVAPVNMISSCKRPLEVNGSLSANQIFLLRTFGTLSGGQSAETINFTPEMWLAPAQSGGIDPTYQSIIGLPPIL